MTNQLLTFSSAQELTYDESIDWVLHKISTRPNTRLGIVAPTEADCLFIQTELTYGASSRRVPFSSVSSMTGTVRYANESVISVHPSLSAGQRLRGVQLHYSWHYHPSTWYKSVDPIFDPQRSLINSTRLQFQGPTQFIWTEVNE